jgi:ribosomal protein S27E
MYDFHDYRCPSCNSSSVVIVQTPAIYDELIECRQCQGIYAVESMHGTARLSAGVLEGPKIHTLTIRLPLNRIR